MTDHVRVRCALLSVSDKSDLVPFAKTLARHGVEIISTGGTAQALSAAGVAITAIDDITGFPEIMDGRVKTLHPKIHGGLLARRDNPDHEKAMTDHGIGPIDLVCVNLYPFERTVGTPGVSQAEAIENIDIGGPSMIRSAAKNAEWVTVVTDPRQYDRVAAELDANDGATTLETRRSLAASAFSRTAAYDRAITAYLANKDRAFPPTLTLDYALRDTLRYGENPHQSAAVYRDPASASPTVVNAEQLHGKRLSYNNYLDAAAALEVVKAFRRFEGGQAGACVVKHTNPCGAAVAPTVGDAVRLGIAGDPLAAYGGILAVNRPIDAAAAEEIAGPDRFFEVVIAPEFDAGALALLSDRWKNVRLLSTGDRPASHQRKLEYRSIPGGMLVQDRDQQLPDTTRWTHAAGPEPTPEVLHAASILELVVRSLSSNAVCIGGVAPELAEGVRLFGAGAGQMDRVASSTLAAQKAGELAKGAIVASDAFFPFPDGPGLLIDAGVTCIVHPGGSKRDEDTFALCNERRVTCLTTGVRRFRH